MGCSAARECFSFDRRRAQLALMGVDSRAFRNGATGDPINNRSGDFLTSRAEQNNVSVLIQQLVTISCCTLACATAFMTGCDDDSTPPGLVEPAVVTVDTLMRFQTMTGWEATAQAGQNEPRFEGYKNSLFDLAVNELGINRLRVEIYAGSENPINYAPSGIHLDSDGCRRWLTINDNDDPHIINPAGFHYSALDSTVVKVVLPMKARLEARGERLFVNLNYVAFLNQCPQPVYVHAQPAEYAEFILAAFLHLRETFGFVPDAVEIILEPDNVTAWSGKLIGSGIVATAARLAAAGFNPVFVAPSTADLGRAFAYLDDIYTVPGVQSLLGELAYHRYGGASSANVAALAQRAKAAGARTAMLEHIGSDVEDLYTDLTVGQVSAWQQYTLAFPTPDNGGHYLQTADGRPALASRTRYLRQYFHYVRMGARRLGAQTSISELRAVAFVNVGGGLVVVMHTGPSGPVEVRGLSPGNYGVSGTTDDLTSVDLGNHVVGAPGTLTFTAPAAGVITAYRK